ncbi:MAG TPA: BamA/TamA family outer membrane protein [Chryseolinea sp.]|nr:BamA/TamA family outer membrane protein [Chryseolinea sp.]
MFPFNRIIPSCFTSVSPDDRPAASFSRFKRERMVVCVVITLALGGFTASSQPLPETSFSWGSAPGSGENTSSRGVAIRDERVQPLASLDRSRMSAHVPVRMDTSVTMQKLNSVNRFMEWYMLYFPVPFGSYSKETNWLFGLTKYNAFTMRHRHKLDSGTQASSITAFGYYTLNTQYKAVLEANLMFSENRAIWKTTLAYIYYPLLYYGVGNNTHLSQERTLNTLNIQLSTSYLFRVWKKWYAGAAYDYYNYSKVELAGDSPSYPGDSLRLANAEGKQSGLGLRVTREGRDNRLNAKKGFYFDASYQFFDKIFGSDFNYQYFQFDARYYFPLFRKFTMATLLRSESRQGDVPVQSMAFLGGDYFMRGSYLGRYRNNVSLIGQAEARFPIFWILGGTLFGGVGQVATDYSKIELGSFHANYGFGLRLKVDSAHDVNLRFDMGFTGDQTLFVMNFSEAF